MSTATSPSNATPTCSSLPDGHVLQLRLGGGGWADVPGDAIELWLDRALAHADERHGVELGAALAALVTRLRDAGAVLVAGGDPEAQLRLVPSARSRVTLERRVETEPRLAGADSLLLNEGRDRFDVTAARASELLAAAAARSGLGRRGVIEELRRGRSVAFGPGPDDFLGAGPVRYLRGEPDAVDPLAVQDLLRVLELRKAPVVARHVMQVPEGTVVRVGDECVVGDRLMQIVAVSGAGPITITVDYRSGEGEPLERGAMAGPLAEAA